MDYFDLQPFDLGGWGQEGRDVLRLTHFEGSGAPASTLSPDPPSSERR